MRPRPPALLLALLLPTFAAAGGLVSDTFTTSSGGGTRHVPKTVQKSDALEASFDLGDDWSLDLGGSATFLAPTSGRVGRRYGTSGGDVTQFDVGLTRELGDAWLVGGGVGLSPRSTLRTDARVPYVDPVSLLQVGADALLEATTSARTVRLSASVDLDPDRDPDRGPGPRLDLDLVDSHFEAEQRILEVRTPSGTLITQADLQAYCAANPCTRQFRAMFRGAPAAMDQAELRLGATISPWKRTDLGLSGSRYLYDRDPTALGFFSLLATGRGTGLSALAPVEWSVRPSVSQGLGPFTLRAWYQHDRFMKEQGSSDRFGARCTWKAASWLKVWVAGELDRDRDSEGVTATSRALSLGASASW